MSERTRELIEALRALTEVQSNGKTLVNNELQAVLRELMQELKIKK